MSHWSKWFSEPRPGAAAQTAGRQRSVGGGVPTTWRYQLVFCSWSHVAVVVKTQETPGEHQNRWYKGVHPPQNGGIGYDPWPRGISLFSFQAFTFSHFRRAAKAKAASFQCGDSHKRLQVRRAFGHARSDRGAPGGVWVGLGCVPSRQVPLHW